MLFIDQERVVAQYDARRREWNPIRATVWLENTTGQAAVFSLTVRPKDPGLRGDWYEATSSPSAVHVHDGQRGEFEVTLNVRRSPHGLNQLIEFQVLATQAGMAGGIAGAFDAAYSGREVIEMTPPPAAPAAAAPSPAGGGLRFYQAGDAGRADVDLVDLGTTPVAAPQAAPGGGGGPGGPAGYAGQSGLDGILVVYIPPVPDFQIEIGPGIDPKRKKKPAAPPKDQTATISGREQGAYAVRVVNRAPHPASFRLKAEGHEGSAYDLGDQYLHAGARETAETTLAARPDGLNWWSLSRSFPFEVQVTPLTGVNRSDEAGRQQAAGVFRQTLAWLHPSTLVGLAVLALTVWLLALPQKIPAELLTRYVLQEDVDLESRRNTGTILDAALAKDAVDTLKLGFGGHLRIRVKSTAAVRLEFRAKPGATVERKLAENEAAEEKGSRDWSFDFSSEKTESETWQVRVVGRSWFGRQMHSDWEDVTVAPGARATLAVEPPSPSLSSIPDGKGGTYRGIRVRLHNLSTGANVDFILAGVPEDVQQRQPPPGAPKSIGPSSRQPYDFEFQGDAATHGGVITVISNSRNGVIRQFRVSGR